MTQQLVNVGVVANDNTGDFLRPAMIKINENFSEVYNEISSLSTVAFSGNYDDLNNLPAEGGGFDGDYNSLDNLPTLGTASAENVAFFAVTARGLPTGGTTGQVLAKTSGTDYAVEWADPAEGGEGIADIVSDTSPQLGGDLDLNGFDILGMIIGTDIQPWDAVLDGTTASFTTALETKLNALPDNTTLASSYVAKSLFDAHTVLAATTDNTPAAITLGANTFLGRTDGNIEALTVTDVLEATQALYFDGGDPSAEGLVYKNQDVNSISLIPGDVSTSLPGTMIRINDAGDEAEWLTTPELFEAWLGEAPEDDHFFVFDSGQLVQLDAADLTTMLGLIPKSLYDANTILYATSNDIPVALTVGASTIVGRKASGDISAMSVSEARTILDVSITGDTVLKSLFDANTMLYATTDNTPVALSIGASTFVGRKASGDISAMSASEARTVLSVSQTSEVVLQTLYDAQSVVVAVSDNTPIKQTVGDSELVGRSAGGNVGVVTAAQLLAIGGAAGAIVTVTGNGEQDITVDDTTSEIRIEPTGGNMTIDDVLGTLRIGRCILVRKKQDTSNRTLGLAVGTNCVLGHAAALTMPSGSGAVSYAILMGADNGSGTVVPTFLEVRFD